MAILSLLGDISFDMGKTLPKWAIKGLIGGSLFCVILSANSVFPPLVSLSDRQITVRHAGLAITASFGLLLGSIVATVISFEALDVKDGNSDV